MWLRGRQTVVFASWIFIGMGRHVVLDPELCHIAMYSIQCIYWRETLQEVTEENSSAQRLTLISLFSLQEWRFTEHSWGKSDASINLPQSLSLSLSLSQWNVSWQVPRHWDLAFQNVPVSPKLQKWANTEAAVPLSKRLSSRAHGSLDHWSPNPLTCR